MVHDVGPCKVLLLIHKSLFKNFDQPAPAGGLPCESAVDGRVPAIPAANGIVPAGPAANGIVPAAAPAANGRAGMPA